MSLHSPSEHRTDDARAAQSRRRHQAMEDSLVLRELSAHQVVDQWARDDTPIELLTFGSVREVCPKCGQSHLKLVLRQECVRVAHLFCADCASCFDACYSNGTPALTI